MDNPISKLFKKSKTPSPKEFTEKLDTMNPEQVEEMGMEAKAHFEEMLAGLQPFEAFHRGAVHMLCVVVEHGYEAKEKRAFEAEMLKHMVVVLYENDADLRKMVDWHLS